MLNLQCINGYCFLETSYCAKRKRNLPRYVYTSFVHYWSEKPTSQYRNTTIFSIINRHKHMFGISASWNYFEAGHGKALVTVLAALQSEWQTKQQNEISRFNLQIISLLGQVQQSQSTTILSARAFVKKSRCRAETLRFETHTRDNEISFSR